MSKILLDKKNYFYNLDLICKQAQDKNKVAVVLKDNAYGHGLIEIATLANEYGIKKAVVRNLDEALEIEKLFDEILILADTTIHTYSHTFHITINCLNDIKKIPSGVKVHLKVDTGMHRNGITKSDLKEAIHGLYKKNVILSGIFTHHRSADELGTDFYWQNRQFSDIKKEVKKLCEELLLPIPAFHSANSSSLFRFKNIDEDWVRVGIAQYGYLESHDAFDNPDLKPIMSLWAHKISSRTVKKNESIGYGATYKAPEDMIVSNYDVGYGDGFLRINENKEYTTPDSSKILGRVSMDNVSINSDKESICLFDNVKELAQLHQTISYEIITTLNPRIPKEIV